MTFQSTPTGFPAGDHAAAVDHVVSALVSIHADRFPGRRRPAYHAFCRCKLFQSTPTGFPAGDTSAPKVASTWSSFNPRRPVSRPATESDTAILVPPAVSIHADRFPGRRLQPCAVSSRADTVSIHADRFPGRRLVPSLHGSSVKPFQSTPTGFPAGDGAEAHRVHGLRVSIHADRFPGRRRQPPSLQLRQPVVSIHADRFPGRRPPRSAPAAPSSRFQSTPTGFPAGDWGVCEFVVDDTVSIHADRFPGRRHGPGRLDRHPDGFNPRRPVSRPATRGAWIGADPVGCFNPRRPVSRPATLQSATPRNTTVSFNPRRPVSRPATSAPALLQHGDSVSIHADRFPGRRPPCGL